jgi:hypothetical protein
MTWYNGDVEDVPRSHMSYVTDGEGPVGERFNFAVARGRFFGYVAPTGGAPYRFSRIDAGAEHHGELSRVLLVFISTRPAELGAGQVVVGWYRNATLYETWKKPKRGEHWYSQRKGWPYCCHCDAEDAVLLPTRARTWPVPRGPGGMGQAKVRYFEAEQPWMSTILERIDAYRGPSIANDARAEGEDGAAISAEITLRGGQGFLLDTRARKAVEDHAMDVAVRAYRNLGYSVSVVGRPYDLFCELHANPQQKIWVEVKGTQGAASDVILTRGEVEFYSSVYPNSELFVVHSIELKDREARGGTTIRHQKWRIRDDALVPIGYWYTLPNS